MVQTTNQVPFCTHVPFSFLDVEVRKNDITDINHCLASYGWFWGGKMARRNAGKETQSGIAMEVPREV